MTAHAHGKRLAAWLGMIAMLLIACAPTVSHLAANARTVAATVCGETATPAQTLLITLDGRQDDPHTAGGQPDPHVLDDCGYCGLMTHEAALPSVPPALPSPLPLLMLTMLLPALFRFTPIGAFPCGRPRAPPVFS